MKKKREENAQGREEDRTVLIGFRMVAVFDVSQTDGFEDWKKQQSELEREVYQSDFPLELAEAIAAKVEGLSKLEKIEGQLNSAKGSYHPVNKEVKYSDGGSLIHEIGHHLDIDGKEERESYAMEELKAEMFTLYVFNKYNVKFNYTYSNIWNSRIKDINEQLDYEKFVRAYNEIGKKADKVLEGIEVIRSADGSMRIEQAA